jgi:hypothetical protein
MLPSAGVMSWYVLMWLDKSSIGEQDLVGGRINT